jgi:hypothetical protein
MIGLGERRRCKSESELRNNDKYCLPADPSQSSISTTALLAFEAAVKHLVALAPGCITAPVGEDDDEDDDVVEVVEVVLVWDVVEVVDVVLE